MTNGYYKFRVRDLKEMLADLPDDDFIMVQLGGHAGESLPITHIEDSTSIGFWELRTDPNTDFWTELKAAKDEGREY